jgi:ABC-type multidrug transport system ATPase subunit
MTVCAAHCSACRIGLERRPGLLYSGDFTDLRIDQGFDMLDIRNVVKTFGKELTAVNDVSLRLERGVVGLIGHNGAGKTTLMQMIATLTRPCSGQIVFDGVDIVEKPNAIRGRLGFLPQDFGVYPNLTALEFI